jgi:hypothetical protein
MPTAAMKMPLFNLALEPSRPLFYAIMSKRHAAQRGH